LSAFFNLNSILEQLDPEIIKALNAVPEPQREELKQELLLKS
jgi:hypothetical protein